MRLTLPNGEMIHRSLKKSELIREDRVRVERLCKHGVGHPIGSIGKWEKWMGVHGCCGEHCCKDY